MPEVLLLSQFDAGRGTRIGDLLSVMAREMLHIAQALRFGYEFGYELFSSFHLGVFNQLVIVCFGSPLGTNEVFSEFHWDHEGTKKPPIGGFFVPS